MINLISLFKRQATCICGQKVDRKQVFCDSCVEKIRQACTENRRKAEAEAIRKGQGIEHINDLVKNYIIYAVSRSEADWSYELSDKALAELLNDIQGDACQVIFNMVHLWVKERGYIE
jgi:hypothetical protein